MEACASAHYWASEFGKMGHEVRLIAPQFVKPYVKSQKNDNDAEAICEAAGRPSMRFVAVKTVVQQDMQAVHRIRSELVRQRTAKANQIRGLMAEYGVVVPDPDRVIAEGPTGNSGRRGEQLEYAVSGQASGVAKAPSSYQCGQLNVPSGPLTSGHLEKLRTPVKLQAPDHP